MEETFRTRENQFEAKFAHDEELKFRIIAHRNKLFGAWTAEQLGAAAPPSYGETLCEYALSRTSADLVQRALHDLQAHGVATSDIKVWKALEHCQDQAEHEVMAALQSGG